MDKDEILRRSQESKIDEGVEFIKNKSSRSIYNTVAIVGLLITLVNIYVGENSFDLYILAFSILLADMISRYRFTKKKIYIIYGTICVIFTIVLASIYLNIILGEL